MTDRQTGQTTRQMLEAPQGAVFIWPNDALYCPKMLAYSLERQDLLIVSPRWLDQQCAGNSRSIVVDHAAGSYFTPRQRDTLRLLLTRA